MASTQVYPHLQHSQLRPINPDSRSKSRLLYDWCVRLRVCHRLYWAGACRWADGPPVRYSNTVPVLTVTMHSIRFPIAQTAFNVCVSYTDPSVEDSASTAQHFKTMHNNICNYRGTKTPQCCLDARRQQQHSCRYWRASFHTSWLQQQC